MHNPNNAPFLGVNTKAAIEAKKQVELELVWFNSILKRRKELCTSKEKD